MEKQDSIPTGAILFNTVIDEETKQGVVRMLKEGASEADIRAAYPCYEGYIKIGDPQVIEECYLNVLACGYEGYFNAGPTRLKGE